jgi:hypothetical protein
VDTVLIFYLLLCRKGREMGDSHATNTPPQAGQLMHQSEEQACLLSPIHVYSA